jgi:hypothetical protein
LTRPSLKITRQAGQAQEGVLVFEVWNPFTGNYQPVDSIKDAMRRIHELATLICQMGLQRHPKQHLLADVPEVQASDDTEWAEFRVNATTSRSYDTRRFDKPDWLRAIDLMHAAETTCTKVGCMLPMPV